VAAIVLTTTIAVVFGTIMSSRKPMVQADRSVRAAIFAKKAMAELRGKVDANTWDQAGSSMVEGNYVNFMNEDGFTASYIVTNDASGGRKVDMKISW
jgi:hypothetical protein